MAKSNQEIRLRCFYIKAECILGYQYFISKHRMKCWISADLCLHSVELTGSNLSCVYCIFGNKNSSNERCIRNSFQITEEFLYKREVLVATENLTKISFKIFKGGPSFALTVFFNFSKTIE